MAAGLIKPKNHPPAKPGDDFFVPQRLPGAIFSPIHRIYLGPFPFAALFQHIFYFILAPYGYTISLYIIFIGLERVYGYEIELYSPGKTN